MEHKRKLKAITLTGKGSDNTPVLAIIEALEGLSVNADALERTQIGRIVAEVCRCSDSELRMRSVALRRRWRRVWLEGRPAKRKTELAGAVPGKPQRPPLQPKAAVAGAGTPPQAAKPLPAQAPAAGQGRSGGSSSGGSAPPASQLGQDARSLALSEIVRILRIDERRADWASKVLCINMSAGAAEAARAFRHLARRIHPDARPPLGEANERRCHEALAKLQRARARV